MGAPRFLLKQLSHPSGPLGSVVGRLLNKSNAQQNVAAIDALAPSATSRVLDVGFGGGVSFPHLLERCTGGRVAGVDISTAMVRRANKIWNSDVAAGRLELREAAVEQLPWDDGSFDGAITINTLYFWPDVPKGLAEVMRVLAPGGRFVASCAQPEMLNKLGFDGMGFRTERLEYYAEAFETAGLRNVTLSHPDGKSAQLVQGTVAD